MKRFLCVFLALLMTMALIPMASAETEKVYAFDMYTGNFEFTASTAQVGDNAQFTDDSSSETGYITFNDGAYVSDAGSNYYLKGQGKNLWTAAVNIKGSTVNGVSITENTYVPRFRLFSRTNIDDGNEYGITFKFKVGTPKVPKNYAITTETYKREFCGTTAVYANGVYLGTINDYVSSSSGKGVNVSSFDAVRLVPDAEGYISLYFRVRPDLNTFGTYIDLMPCAVTFTETELEALDTVSLYATVLNGEGGSISSDSSDVTIGEVNEVSAGKSITLTAKAAEGYKFAYWTDSEGRALSDESLYTFSANCNGVIWAVFDKIGDTEKTGVDFFDGNRDSLGFVAAESGTIFGEIEAPTPGLTGYEFTGWSVSEDTVINGLIRAVAQYAEEGKTLSEAVIKVNGEEQGEKKYGEAVICKSDDAAVWYLNGKPVAYGKSYTHYAWGSVEITSDNIEASDKAPLVTLNESNGAYMMEYDAGDYTLLEAGILFGNESRKTLSACYSKAKVRNVSDHGSFTAKAKANGSDGMQTLARGYAVYKNGDGISVVYSD